MTAEKRQKAMGLSGEAKAYVREVRDGIKETCGDLTALEKPLTETLTVVDSLQDAYSVLSEVIDGAEISDATENTRTVLKAAKNAAEHADQLEDSYPVISVGLRLVGLSLVRSLRTVVQASKTLNENEERVLENTLSRFETLPHANFSAWLDERVQAAVATIDEASSKSKDTSKPASSLRPTALA